LNVRLTLVHCIYNELRMNRFRCALLTPVFLLATVTHAQPCSCPATFDWMVRTFEENDAGFKLVVDRKGEAEYAKHTADFRAQVAGAKDPQACAGLMNQWLQWFRKGHIGVMPLEPALKGAAAVATPGNGPGPRVIPVSEAQLMKQWGEMRQPGPFEGIWTMGAYRVAVMKDAERKDGYVAVILASKNPNWKPGDVKAEFAPVEGGFAGTYYMGDRSPMRTAVSSVPGTTALLDMNGFWARVFPVTALSPAEALLLRVQGAELPFVERLSERTLYLRIPSFLFEQKRAIDSVLAANDALIRSTENLVIDIRNGTGGADASYSGLIPYLYTGPMRSVGAKLWSTELNAQGYEYFADQRGRDTEDGRRCLEVARGMRAAPGTWLDMNEQIWSVDSSYTVLPLPRRIGIICNEGNGSTDEQFLLDARTSAKVKIFGRPTKGSLDVSNVHMVNSPDGCYQLGYCMSLSHRLPHMPVDVMGIQPDHYLDEAIPKLEWVEYVQQVLEGR
jgi:hypothetical protein